jgi:hypothetical protein
MKQYQYVKSLESAPGAILLSVELIEPMYAKGKNIREISISAADDKGVGLKDEALPAALKAELEKTRAEVFAALEQNNFKEVPNGYGEPLASQVHTYSRQYEGKGTHTLQEVVFGLGFSASLAEKVKKQTPLQSAKADSSSPLREALTALGYIPADKLDEVVKTVISAMPKEAVLNRSA